MTIHPTGYTETPTVQDEAAVVGNMARFRESPFDFFREISLHVSGTGWRSYDSVIGQPIYYTGFSENMKAAVLSTPMLQEKIRQLAERRVSVEENEGFFENGDGDAGTRKSKRKMIIENSLHEVAEGITDDMICKMESRTFIRGAYYVATQLLTRAYHQGLLQQIDVRLHGRL